MTRFLDIVTCIANPLRWESRTRVARATIADWLKDPNVRVTLVECAYGARGYELADLASDRVRHVPVRATSLVWNKECLLNIGVARLEPGARYIGTFDADVIFRRKGWAENALNALDLYPVIQPWDVCYDLGPHDEHIQTHKSFGSIFHAGGPVAPASSKFWAFDGGPYDYPHSGYAWCWVRDVLDKIGGLFELGGTGSGDHHMALALAGLADYSLPQGVSASYRDTVKYWEERAKTHVNRKIGFVHGTIEHAFHGRKDNRNYVGRWDMFLEHGFDPHRDLKRNSFGVLEFSGGNPDLERAFDRYLRTREEDVNTLS